MQIRFLFLLFLLLSNNSLHAQPISDLQDQLQTLQGLLNKLSNALKALPIIPPVPPVVPAVPQIPVIPPPVQTILIPQDVKNVLSQPELEYYLADQAMVSALLTLKATPDIFKKVAEYRTGTGLWPELGNIIPMIQVPVVPPPPVAPEVPGGPPPPPPPPPIGVPTKPKGLTQPEADALTIEEKKKSDQYLLDIIKAAARKRTGAFSALSKALSDQFKRLSGASDFKFTQDNTPEQLIQAIMQWIDTNLKKQNGELEAQFLGRVYQGLLSDNLQNEFADVIQDWLWLPLSGVQRKQLVQNAEDIAINLVAAQRTPSDNPDQNQRYLSDDAFLASFNVNDIDSLIRFLNVLRVHPSYLKYTSLQEDIPTGPVSEVPIQVISEQPVVELKELTKQIKERKYRALLKLIQDIEDNKDKLPAFDLKTIEKELAATRAVLQNPEADEEKLQKTTDQLGNLWQKVSGQIEMKQPVKPQKRPAEPIAPVGGIIQELEANRRNPKALNVAAFTPEYLGRYMFNPARFESVRENFMRKILKQMVIKPKIAAISFGDYFDSVLNDAWSLNEIFNFIKTLVQASNENKLQVGSNILLLNKRGSTVQAMIRINDEDELDRIKYVLNRFNVPPTNSQAFRNLVANSYKNFTGKELTTALKNKLDQLQFIDEASMAQSLFSYFKKEGLENANSYDDIINFFNAFPSTIRASTAEIPEYNVIKWQLNGKEKLAVIKIQHQKITQTQRDTAETLFKKLKDTINKLPAANDQEKDQLIGQIEDQLKLLSAGGGILTDAEKTKLKKLASELGKEEE